MASFTVQRSGEPALACAVHFPENRPHATVLIIHGHGEHQGCYRHVIDAWLQRGFAIGIFDLRGHGNSQGKRSHITHFDDYVHDAQAVLAELDRQGPWRDVGRPIIFGHSLGGLISIQLILSAQANFRGLAMTSPYLGLAVKVSPIALWLGRTLSNAWPTFTLNTPVKSTVLTHDPEKKAECDADTLRTSAVTARFFTEVERVQRLTLSTAKDVRLPVYCLAAGDDRVVSVKTTERWFADLGSEEKELRVIPGAFHELFNEIDRARHLSATADCFERWAAKP
ncbi:MAG TPA: lysophospholipase [Polyangiaceae bacterium]|nr:lysophospholipase [Polyangiaceae bacterium]